MNNSLSIFIEFIDQNTIKSLSVIIIILISFIICQESKAQDMPVIVEYKDGNLPKKLPYGTSFVIQGEPNIISSEGTVEQVIFSIIPEDNSDSTSYVWKKKNAEDKLKIEVDDELYPGKKYKFKFDIYIHRKIESKAVQEIIDSVKLIAINKFIDDGGSSLSELDNVTRNVITHISKNYPNYYYYDGDKEINKIKFSYNQEWLQNVMDIAMNERLIKLENNEILTSFLIIKSISDTINKDTLNESERNCILAISQSQNYTELLLDLENLTSCLSNIDSVYNELQYIEVKQNSINDLQQTMDFQQDQLKTLEDQLKLTKQLEVKTISWKTDENNIKTNSTTIEQVGLRYGIAYSPISYDYSQWFQFITTRFYFWPIDKNMGQPYYKPHNRLALNVGAIVGNIEYNGQKLHDINNLGIKLLTGISYDVTKQWSITGGTIWFEYNEGNPFNEIRETKASFYLGLSFDFNIIENIKK
ncbi:MAG: hypothetical protein OEW87_09495 [Flavobacteriaceae bacterium]|nr:hypothetical protein [Flavobacteriaceae bacterium]